MKGRPRRPLPRPCRALPRAAASDRRHAGRREDRLQDRRARKLKKAYGEGLAEKPEIDKREWLESLCADVAALAKGGTEILLVSSGAIALGRTVLKLPKGALKLEESQASAAVGQIALARAYDEALGAHGLTTSQILLTLGDTEERRRYLNARATVDTLLRLKAVPVINENDTVATSEIRYGDNDRLAARVATMMGADLLILLSDIDGLYTAPPHLDPKAEFLPVIEKITPAIEAMAGAAASEISKGGMKTKLDAGKIATAAGTAMIITSGARLSGCHRPYRVHCVAPPSDRGWRRVCEHGPWYRLFRGGSPPAFGGLRLRYRQPSVWLR
jgi:glutamate 5-kinase